MSAEMKRLLLRPKEAFEMAGVGRSIGYRLIESGEWPSIRVGKAIRVPADGLRAWIEKKLSEQDIR
jgi:excisionase family DNA binding protein